MRLACLWGMPLRRLDEEVGSDELCLWRAFQALYDLPDGFHVAAGLGPPLYGLAGARATPNEYFSPAEAPHAPGRPHPSIVRFGAMVAAHRRRRARAGPKG